MKVLTVKQIRQADAYTIEHEPVKSIDLMERASAAASDWIFNTFGKSKKLCFFAGPGNNGGDGLAMARILSERDIEVAVFMLSPASRLSEDASVNLQRLGDTGRVEVKWLAGEEDFPAECKNCIIVDAMFGSGLTRPIEGKPAGIVKKINDSQAIVVSVDIPSGLFGEDNRDNTPETIVRADYTLSFQFPKLAFFFPENNPYTGEWHVLPIGLHPNFIESVETPYYFVTAGFFSGQIKCRNKFAHKGDFGHSLIISGSYGKMGAAVLAVKACLRAGSGLVTAHVPQKGIEIIQTSVPEAMTSADKSPVVFTGITDPAGYTSIAAGPGIGQSKDTCDGLRSLLKGYDRPMVLDADALNILSANKELLKMLPPASILTPHPKEFDRMAGNSGTGYERHLKQIDFSRRYGVYIVLKGGYTSVSTPEGHCYFNSTGNPGMATAGSGDVLTGIIVSLLSQGYSPDIAAKLGVYIHGLAGDIAAGSLSQESMIAGDIIDEIGCGFKKIKNYLSHDKIF